jgi:hypothetical protein
MMKVRSLVIMLSMLCVLLGWRLAAWPSVQQQSQHQTLTMNSAPLVATDADIKLLRQDLRTQKQKIIAQNLPMTETEAVKFWAVYNRYTEDLRQINDEKYRLVKQYGEDWGAITNDQALIYIRRWLEVDDQVPIAVEICDGRKPSVAGKESSDVLPARSTASHDDRSSVSVAITTRHRTR